MSSLLDSLVADVTGRKVSATLTPVGTEVRKPRIPEVPEVFLTNEAVTDIAKDLRTQAALLLQVADALDAQTGTPSERFDTRAHVVDAQKVREREADARAATEEPFKDRLDRLSKEAQDAAYGGNLVPAATEVFADVALIQPATSGSVTKGWTCPAHGSTNLMQTTSRKGREYTLCATCNQFEK